MRAGDEEHRAEGEHSAAVHAGLTRALLDHYVAHAVSDDFCAKRAALLDELWAQYTEHHADFDRSDARLRTAFERSAERIVELNGLKVAGANARACTDLSRSNRRAGTGSHMGAHPPRDLGLAFGFTRMAVIDEEAFAARLAAWKPMPAGLAAELPRLRDAAGAGAGEPSPGAWPVGSNATATRFPWLSSPLVGTLPATFDWSGRGVLTAVKDQRDCGACWSFTTVQTLEAAVAVIGGSLATLSAQQLLDCDQSWNQGCIGGNVAASIGYLRKYGAMRDDDYPYRNAASEACAYRPSLVAVRVSELMRIPPGSETQLQHALLQFGPLAVSVDASGWQHYAGGIIAQCADGGVNHAVQLVGWGTTSNGIDYWNIRNSWSAAWGELGYARLLRGVGCNGIVDEPAYTFVVAGQECIAYDCGRCVGEGPRCGWCGGAGRCFTAEVGEATCAHGWLDATCPPALPPPRGLRNTFTCGTAAAAASGQAAPYVAIRIDRVDWRQGSACVLGYEMNATQAAGLLLLLLTALCWLLQAAASCCCCPEGEGERQPLVFDANAGGAGAGVPLLGGEARRAGQRPPVSEAPQRHDSNAAKSTRRSAGSAAGLEPVRMASP